MNYINFFETAVDCIAMNTIVNQYFKLISSELDERKQPSDATGRF